MKLKLKINRHTTSSELIQLGMLFTGLGLNGGAKVVSFSPPTDPAELDEPELTIVPPAEEPVINKAAGTEVPKRRRRTRAEIEAENAERSQVSVIEDTDPHQTQVEQGAEAATVIAEDTSGNDQAAPTPTVPETTNGAAETPATESPSDGKTYTAAEVQQQATVVARTHGADLVKAKIAELGGARIADLNAEQVNTLGAYLFSVK